MLGKENASQAPSFHVMNDKKTSSQSVSPTETKNHEQVEHVFISKLDFGI